MTPHEIRDRNSGPEHLVRAQLSALTTVCSWPVSTSEMYRETVMPSGRKGEWRIDRQGRTLTVLVGIRKPRAVEEP